MLNTRRDFLESLAGFSLLPCVGCRLCDGNGLRYASTGELHKDFHASILDGLDYVREIYGEKALAEVLGAFAKDVYRSMHEKLVVGDASELREHWRYYMDREQGRYRVVDREDGGVELEVLECPACAHLRKRNVPGGERLCEATGRINAALCEGSPFESALEQRGDGRCRQIIRRKGAAA